MTYSDFEDIARFKGKLEAEMVAARYCAVLRNRMVRFYAEAMQRMDAAKRGTPIERKDKGDAK